MSRKYQTSLLHQRICQYLCSVVSNQCWCHHQFDRRTIKVFAIYPLNGKTLKQSILLDVTFKANDLQSKFYYEMDSPPKLRVIQNGAANNNECFQCPPDVTNNLQMLNNKYGLNNVDYVCVKVLGCHHASYVNSEHVEGFGMTVGGFFFLSFKKQDELIKTDVQISQ